MLRSQKAPKLAALQQASSHAPEPKSSEAYCVAASSRAGQAPEFAALQQQALTLWSLLLQHNKLSCFGACYVAASKLRNLLRCSSKLSRSGAEQAPELGALQGLVAASKLRSREAPEKLRSLELACLFKQNKQK
jgi:hypothetical protein